jgi:SAM-dependent methyltransferase
LASGGELTPEAAAAYADRAYEVLAGDGGVTPGLLSGARVVEVGPGETLTLALRLVAAGARQVMGIDRFAVQADPSRQRSVYAALAARLDGEESERAAAALRDGVGPPLDPARGRLVDGVPIEEARSRLDPDSFDIAVSIAALQHCLDPEAALRSLDALLAPGGLMAHQVDFSDMGMFSGRGLHPLTFLTVGDRRYDWMGSNLGIPNRGLVDVYRRTLASLGYETNVKVTQVLGDDHKLPYRERLIEGRDFGSRHVELVEQIRPRLLARYRALPVEDLLVASALIVARKPDRY